MSDWNAPSGMEPLSEDRAVDRLFTGARCEDPTWDEVADFFRETRTTYMKTLDARVEYSQLEAILAAAEELRLSPVVPPVPRHQRRVLVPGLRLRIAAGMGALSLGFGSLAATGVLPDPVQGAVSRFVARFGISIPDPSSDSPASDGREPASDQTQPPATNLGGETSSDQPDAQATTGQDGDSGSASDLVDGSGSADSSDPGTGGGSGGGTGDWDGGSDPGTGGGSGGGTDPGTGGGSGGGTDPGTGGGSGDWSGSSDPGTADGSGSGEGTGPSGW